MNKGRIVGTFIIIVLLFIVWGASLQKHEQRVTLAEDVTVVAADDDKRKLGTLAKSTTIWLDAVCDEWCYITWGETAAKFAAPAQSTIEHFKERDEQAAAGNELLRVVTAAPVFAKKSEGSKTIATLAANETYVAQSIGDKWAKVTMPNGEGYVALTHTLTEKATRFSDMIETNVDATLYQFDSAEKRYEIGTLRAHEPVEVVGTTRYYYIVSFGQGEAYVEREHASETTAKDFLDVHLQNDAAGSFMLKTATPVYVSMERDADVLAILQPNMRYSTIGQWGKWAIVRIGGRVGYIEQRADTASNGIAVLHYEHVLPAQVAKQLETNHTVVTAEQFEQQMAYLAAQGYTTITKTNLADYVAGSFVLPEKAVLITFDGGLLSAKEYAYPILQEHHFTAVQHVIASRVTRESGTQVFDETKEQYITVADMTTTSDVFDHEAQTFNMHQLIGNKSVLVEADINSVKDDLRQLVKALGKVTAFAYPFGQYSDDVIEALQEYGFTMAFTQERAHVTIGADAMQLPRYSITEETTMKQFEKIVRQ